MRVLVVVIVLVIVLAMEVVTGISVHAADFGTGARRGHHGHWRHHHRYYADCGRVPYRGDAYRPDPNTTFYGPVGYRCYAGRIVYFPDYPQCRRVLVRGRHGWVRARRCY